MELNATATSSRIAPNLIPLRNLKLRIRSIDIACAVNAHHRLQRRVGRSISIGLLLETCEKMRLDETGDDPHIRFSQMPIDHILFDENDRARDFACVLMRIPNQATLYEARSRQNSPEQIRTGSFCRGNRCRKRSMPQFNEL